MDTRLDVHLLLCPPRDSHGEADRPKCNGGRTGSLEPRTQVFCALVMVTYQSGINNKVDSIQLGTCSQNDTIYFMVMRATNNHH